MNNPPQATAQSGSQATPQAATQPPTRDAKLFKELSDGLSKDNPQYAVLDILKLYKQKGGDLKKAKFKDSDDEEIERNLLYWAITSLEEDSAAKVVEYLLDNQVNIEERSGRYQRTALYTAVENDNAAVTQLLLQYGADVNAGDDTDWTPAYEAAGHEFQEPEPKKSESIPEKETIPSRPEKTQPERKPSSPNKLLELLIDHGADIDHTTSDFHETPLFHAVELNVIGNVEFLLDMGAQPLFSDINNDTPLHCAVKNGNEDMVRLLLSKGAQPDSTGSDNDTPLHCAVRNGDAGMVELLLSKGADMTIKNVNGETARNLAEGRQIQTTILAIFDSPPVSLQKSDEAAGQQEKPLLSSKDMKDVCKGFKAYIGHYSRGAAKSLSYDESVYDIIYGDRLKDLYRQSQEQFNSLPDNPAMPRIQEDKMLRWIHLPGNNILWVNDLIKRLMNMEFSTTKMAVNKALCKEILQFVDDSFYPHIGATERDCFRKAWCESDSIPNASSVSANKGKPPTSTEPAPTGKASEGDKTKPQDAKKEQVGNTPLSYLSLVIPYVDMETEEYFNRYNTDVPRMSTLQTPARTQNFEKMRKLTNVYSRDLKKPPFLHLSRTLDQSYYETLGDEKTKQRDLNQVVFQYTKSKKSRETQGERLNVRIPAGSSPNSQGLESSTNQHKDRPESKGGEKIQREESDNLQAQPQQQQDSSNVENNLTGRRKSQGGGQLRPEKPDKEIKRPVLPKHEVKLLMVNQLWLWKISHTNTIITAFPERWTQIFPPELKNWIIKGRPELCDTLDGLTACIVQQTVGFVQEPWNCGLDEHVLDIFARKIAELSNSETECFDGFSQTIKKNGSSERTSKTSKIGTTQDSTVASKGTTKPLAEEKRFTSKVTMPEPTSDKKSTSTGTKSIGTDQTKNEQLESKRVTILEEVRHLKEIKGIRNELGMLQRVFLDQKAVIEKVAKVSSVKGADRETWKSIAEDYGIASNIERIKRLLEDAKRVQDGLDYLLTLKQAQSTLDEAESTRQQGNFIAFFTVVTIIFAPLTFLAACFALQIEDYPHNTQGISLPRSWVVRNLFVGEITAIVPIGFVALIMYIRQVGLGVLLIRLRRLGHSAWKNTEEYIQHIVHPQKTPSAESSTSHQPPPVDNGAQPPFKPENDEKGQNSTEDTEILYEPQRSNTGLGLFKRKHSTSGSNV